MCTVLRASPTGENHDPARSAGAISGRQTFHLAYPAAAPDTSPRPRRRIRAHPDHIGCPPSAAGGRRGQRECRVGARDQVLGLGGVGNVGGGVPETCRVHGDAAAVARDGRPEHRIAERNIPTGRADPHRGQELLPPLLRDGPWPTVVSGSSQGRVLAWHSPVTRTTRLIGSPSRGRPRRLARLTNRGEELAPAHSSLIPTATCGEPRYRPGGRRAG